jgi:hypothetical protein
MTTTKRRVFFSFHYERDNWRAEQIRELCMGSLFPNEKEPEQPGCESTIAEWIGAQLKTADCTVVLIGSETSDRGWVKYEIAKSWNDGKGVLGIDVHALPDEYGQHCFAGQNPFDEIIIDGRQLSSVVPVYKPRRANQADACDYINHNIAGWVENAILIRGQYPQSHVTAS